MEYSNNLVLHDADNNVLGIVAWFSDAEPTLSEAKRMAKPLMDMGYHSLSYSSSVVGSNAPIFIVVEENSEYGIQN